VHKTILIQNVLSAKPFSLLFQQPALGYSDPLKRQNSQMADPSEAVDQLWLPNPAFPGEQTMIYRNSQTRPLVALSMAKTRRVMRVRAVLTDQSHP